MTFNCARRFARIILPVTVASLLVAAALAGQAPAQSAEAATSSGLNVRSPPFNAKGDGLTDDTAALQAALDYPGHRPIYLPSGKYLIRATLQATNYQYESWYASHYGAARNQLTITGDGKLASLIVAAAGMSNMFETKWQFSGAFVNLGFDANKLATNCLEVSAPKLTRFERVYFANALNAGLRANYAICDHVIECEFRSNHIGAQFTRIVPEVKGTTWSHNNSDVRYSLFWANDIAISAEGGATTFEITGNAFELNRECAILLYPAWSALRIVGNYFEDIRMRGLPFASPRRICRSEIILNGVDLPDRLSGAYKHRHVYIGYNSFDENPGISPAHILIGGVDGLVVEENVCGKSPVRTPIAAAYDNPTYSVLTNYVFRGNDPNLAGLVWLNDDGTPRETHGPVASLANGPETFSGSTPTNIINLESAAWKECAGDLRVDMVCQLTNIFRGAKLDVFFTGSGKPGETHRVSFHAPPATTLTWSRQTPTNGAYDFVVPAGRTVHVEGWARRHTNVLMRFEAH